MSQRGRLGFVAACLLAFALIAALITWGRSSTLPSSKTPATVTLAPGATRPAGLAVTDLHDIEQLQAPTTRRRCCAEAVLINLEDLTAIAATHGATTDRSVADVDPRALPGQPPSRDGP